MQTLKTVLMCAPLLRARRQHPTNLKPYISLTPSLADTQNVPRPPALPSPDFPRCTPPPQSALAKLSLKANSVLHALPDEDNPHGSKNRGVTWAKSHSTTEGDGEGADNVQGSGESAAVVPRTGSTLQEIVEKRKALQQDAEVEEDTLQGDSCFCFGPRNPLRRTAAKVGAVL